MHGEVLWSNSRNLKPSRFLDSQKRTIEIHPPQHFILLPVVFRDFMLDSLYVHIFKILSFLHWWKFSSFSEKSCSGVARFFATDGRTINTRLSFLLSLPRIPTQIIIFESFSIANSLELMLQEQIFKKIEASSRARWNCMKPRHATRAINYSPTSPLPASKAVARHAATLHRF